MSTSLRPFSESDLQKLSRFAERLNAHRETGSSFCCSKAEDILQDFASTAACGFACWQDGTPLGLISCFPDREKGNADCSLLIEAQGDSYREIAQALLGAARQNLGPEMACTFFFPTENEACRRFLQSAGARRQSNEYILRLRGADWNPCPHPAAHPRPLRREEAPAFIALHDAIFPDVYVSGKDIWRDCGQSRRIYVIPDEAGLAAYGVLKAQGGARAVAEILGVRENVRRRGYGRAMLNHLACQAFSCFGARELELVVDADNEKALRLYRNTGFTIRQENNCCILP